MEISLRLKTIASMVDKCDCIVDVGTDHAYIPIYLVKNNICKSAIASDINKGPIERAENNIRTKGLSNSIECRLGAGLNPIKPKEADGAVIAGMGGNMIKDILEESQEVFKLLDFLVLQPVQNPEVLRKYIYDKGYKVLEEGIVFDENKFYEIIKIRYDNNPEKLEPIYYEIGKDLIDKNHKLLSEFINYKIDIYNKILIYIKEDTEGAKARKKDIIGKITKLKELLR